MQVETKSGSAMLDIDNSIPLYNKSIYSGTDIGNSGRAATPTAKATKIDDLEKYKTNFYRCVKCYQIISLSPDKLDVNGNLVPSNLDSKPHLCLNFDVIEESDILIPDRISDELFLQMIRAGGYIEQARILMYRIPVFDPTPVFAVHLADIQDDKIKRELAALADADDILDNVMRTAIGRVFECVNERQYNLSVRKLLRWEIIA
jgi:hypothetical protein